MQNYSCRTYLGPTEAILLGTTMMIFCLASFVSYQLVLLYTSSLYLTFSKHNLVIFSTVLRFDFRDRRQKLSVRWKLEFQNFFLRFVSRQNNHFLFRVYVICRLVTRVYSDFTEPILMKFCVCHFLFSRLKFGYILSKKCTI